MCVQAQAAWEAEQGNGSEVSGCEPPLLPLSAAKAVRDAFLLALLFGYLAPLRPSTLASLT